MAKILLMNPNKWGRGITHIWITSHSSILKKNSHTVEYFDASFYSDWSVDEIAFNTENKQYKPSDYSKNIKYNERNIFSDLQDTIDNFKPDFIFWSAISSHIHGEGEYVNIQNGYDLIKKINIPKNTILVTGGLQATADPKLMLDLMPLINIIIRGESELVLSNLLGKFSNKQNIYDEDGIAYLENNDVICTKRQKLINDLDILSPYDYSLFDKQVFIRPYNGNLVKAIDYELSRGCIYSCSYCVETVIQRYYEFNDITPSGAIKNAKSYLRNKSAKMIFSEIMFLSKTYEIELFRCQDTNFLTINRRVLLELADLIDNSDIKIKMYIETRPEGINLSTIELMKKLKIDGVGMGVELSSEDFRESNLNRFANQEKTINAFRLLKENGIKATSYNVIGFPNQTEESILSTIEFNKILDPDNITVAYYSPYYGTDQQRKSVDEGLFNEYEFDVDGQLRSTTIKDALLSKDKLNYYKNNFHDLVRN